MRLGLKLLILSTLYCLLFTPAYAQEVDILWQGETEVPPFYKGLPIWGTRTFIKLVGIPQEVTRIDPAQAMYWWSKEETALGNYNGVGKNSLTFLDSPYRTTRKVKLELVTESFTPLAKKSIEIFPRSQNVLVYEDHPLYGLMLHREVGEEYEVDGDEITLRAIPLYFDAINIEGEEIEYAWRSGNSTQTGSAVTYRIPEGSSGTSQVRVGVSMGNNSQQTAGKSFSLEFK